MVLMQEQLRTYLNMGKDRRECLQRLCLQSATLYQGACLIFILSWAPMIVKDFDDLSDLAKPTIAALVNAANSPTCPPAFPFDPRSNPPAALAPAQSNGPRAPYVLLPAAITPTNSPSISALSSPRVGVAPTVLGPQAGSSAQAPPPGFTILAQPSLSANLPGDNPAVQLTFKATA